MVCFETGWVDGFKGWTALKLNGWTVLKLAKKGWTARKGWMAGKGGWLRNMLVDTDEVLTGQEFVDA